MDKNEKMKKLDRSELRELKIKYQKLKNKWRLAAILSRTYMCVILLFYIILYVIYYKVATTQLSATRKQQNIDLGVLCMYIYNIV